MRILSLIFFGIIAATCIAFAILNASSITVNYVFGEKELPLIVIMFVSMILGVLLSLCAMTWKVLKLKAKIHQLKSQLKKAEQSQKSTDMTFKEL